MEKNLPFDELGRRPLVMGILNVTPDSFSGDGLLQQGDYVAAALQQAISMVAAGADMLDVGGESTRPGAEPVDADEEIRRIVPVLRVLHAKFPEIPLSIDTTKPKVARAALAAGATILNDISGADVDGAMRNVAAQSGAYLVLMHNAAQAEAVRKTETIGGEYEAPLYDDDVVIEVARDLCERAALAQAADVPPDHIILDPGIGFGKSVEQNLRLINHLDRLTSLGYPVLLGASRKSFIGRVLDLPPEERLEGTAAAVAIGTFRGASILRVHDVAFMARVVRLVEKLAAA